MSNYQNKVTSQEQYPPQYQNNTYAQGTEITPMSSQPQMQQPMNEKHEYTAQERGQSYTGQQPQQTPGVSMPMPQQQQQPQQSMAQGQQYQTAIPLYALGPGPAPVDCPVCHVRALTRVEYETGNTTYAWAAGLCAFFCLGCIPFCIDSTKNVVHYCGHEGTRLAMWHRSGVTQVYVHP